MDCTYLKKNDNLFYVNSIIQQLYRIPIFRDAILSIDTTDIVGEKKTMMNEL